MQATILLLLLAEVFAADTDGDGLDDSDEVLLGTDALDADSDDDGALDGAEVAAHCDPTHPDTDGDRVADGEELGVSAPHADTDQLRSSYRTDLDPGILTDPTEADTDGDGLTDYEEMFLVGSDPSIADSDGDGAVDGDEIRLSVNLVTNGDFEDGTNGWTTDYPTDRYAIVPDASTVWDWSAGLGRLGTGYVFVANAPTTTGQHARCDEVELEGDRVHYYIAWYTHAYPYDEYSWRDDALMHLTVDGKEVIGCDDLLIPELPEEFYPHACRIPPVDGGFHGICTQSLVFKEFSNDFLLDDVEIRAETFFSDPFDDDSDDDGLFDGADCEPLFQSVNPTWFLDADGDGYGDDDHSSDDCEVPPGYVDRGGDCDDTEALVFPDATETCDGVDNDCDTHTDEDLPTTDFYPDRDEDGFGDDSAAPEAFCGLFAGWVSDASDCDDSDASVYPGAPEISEDGIDQDCTGSDRFVQLDGGEALCGCATTPGSGSVGGIVLLLLAGLRRRGDRGGG
jgi:MYXO-CTERM domain-containing protein